MELHRAPLAWCPLLGEGQKPLCLPCPPWSRSQPPAARSGELRCKDHSRGEKSPSPTMGAPSKPQAVPSVFPPCPGLHPAGSLVPSPAAPGDGTRDSGSKGRESHASRRSWQPVCTHQGTRRSQGQHTPPTRLPRSHRILPCPVPASGNGTRAAIPREAGASWPSQPPYLGHSHCTARIQRESGQGEPDPQEGGGGSAGQNHALIYHPSQEPDPHPPCGDNLAQSSAAPWSSHGCVAIPRGCPERGEIRVLFSSWNCLGKAEPPSIATACPEHPRKCLLPAPALLLHPEHREMAPTHKPTNVVFYPGK